MELRTLKYFLVVAREGSLTKAAKYLHVTQPTLSVQMKQLEEELGKQLFTRSNYSINLTEEGMKLKKRAEDILELVDKTVDEIKNLSTVNGVIQIGSSESVNLLDVVKIFKEFRERYPSVSFDLYSGDTKRMEERISSGLMDFAIISQPQVDLEKYNYLVIPKKDVWGVLMRKDDPLACKEYLTIEDIIERDLIISRQSLKEDLPKWFENRIDGIKVVATYDLIYNASLFVKEGMGIALAFEGIVDTSEESDLCFRRLYPQLDTEMYIIWKRHAHLSEASLLLLEKLKEKLKNL